MSKKVISLALAVVMLFSLASTSFAALGTDKKMGFVVSASSTTVAPGDTVEITVSAQTAGEAWGSIVVPMAYDNDVISLPAAATSGVNTAWTDYLTLSSAYGAKVNAAYSSTEPYDYSALTERTEDQGKNWDTGVQVCMVCDAGTTYTFDGVQELFTLKFTVADDATPGSKIQVGIPACAFDGDPPIGMAYSEDYGMEYWVDYDGEVYDFTEATVELTVAAANVVFHDKVQVQWADEANNVMNLGFKGYFKAADIPIAFGEDNRSTNIVEVGAKVTGNGTQTAGTNFVYTPDDGVTYYFRGVLPVDLDVEEQANTAITVEYYVKDKDNNVYWSAPVTLKTAAEYATKLA